LRDCYQYRRAGNDPVPIVHKTSEGHFDPEQQTII